MVTDNGKHCHLAEELIDETIKRFEKQLNSGYLDRFRGEYHNKVDFWLEHWRLSHS